MAIFAGGSLSTVAKIPTDSGAIDPHACLRGVSRRVQHPLVNTLGDCVRGNVSVSVSYIHDKVQLSQADGGGYVRAATPFL